MKNEQSQNAPRAESVVWFMKSCGMLAHVALAFATPAFAGVIAQNEAVDYIMATAAGTASDPSVYLQTKPKRRRRGVPALAVTRSSPAASPWPTL